MTESNVKDSAAEEMRTSSESPRAGYERCFDQRPAVVINVVDDEVNELKKKVDEIQQTRNLQRITIEYQSIEVTYASGKPASATDDWETP